MSLDVTSKAVQVPQRGSQSASRAAAVLLNLSEQRRPRSLTEIAADLGAAKSSMSGVLVSLEASGLIRREEGGYSLGPAVVELASGFLQSYDVVAEFRRGIQESPVLGVEVCQLAVLSGDEVLYLGRHAGRPPLGFSAAPGDRFPASITAVGAALLASLDDQEVRRLYPADAEFPIWTGNSTPDLDALLAKLAAARKRGWAIDNGETNPNVYGIAVVVRRSSVHASDLAIGASLRPIRGAAQRAQEVAQALLELRDRLESPNAFSQS